MVTFKLGLFTPFRSSYYETVSVLRYVLSCFEATVSLRGLLVIFVQNYFVNDKLPLRRLFGQSLIHPNEHKSDMCVHLPHSNYSGTLKPWSVEQNKEARLFGQRQWVNVQVTIRNFWCHHEFSYRPFILGVSSSRPFWYSARYQKHDKHSAHNTGSKLIIIQQYVGLLNANLSGLNWEWSTTG